MGLKVKEATIYKSFLEHKNKGDAKLFIVKTGLP